MRQFFPQYLMLWVEQGTEIQTVVHRPQIKKATWFEIQFCFPININNLSATAKCPSTLHLPTVHYTGLLSLPQICISLSFFLRALNLLFLLPETPFPWIFTWLAPSHTGYLLRFTTLVKPSSPKFLKLDSLPSFSIK